MHTHFIHGPAWNRTRSGAIQESRSDSEALPLALGKEAAWQLGADATWLWIATSPRFGDVSHVDRWILWHGLLISGIVFWWVCWMSLDVVAAFWSLPAPAPAHLQLLPWPKPPQSFQLGPFRGLPAQFLSAPGRNDAYEHRAKPHQKVANCQSCRNCCQLTVL